MNGFSLLLAALSLGVDYGWQPTQDGHLEYIVQIEPVTLIAMREGQEVVSQIDPQMRTVRRFRVHVGTEMVPRRGSAPQQLPTTGVTTATIQALPGVQFGWQPLEREQWEFIVNISPERMTGLRTGDDIVGEIPIDLPNVTRLRIISGTGTLPRQNSQAGNQAGYPQGYSAGLQSPQNNQSLLATGANNPQPLMLAPRQNNTPAASWGQGANGLNTSSSSSWLTPPSFSSSTWSAASNPNSAYRDQNAMLQDQQRNQQLDSNRQYDPSRTYDPARPYASDPSRTAVDNRSGWGGAASAGTPPASSYGQNANAIADPRFASQGGAPIAQGPYDQARQRDNSAAAMSGYGAPTQQRWDGTYPSGTNARAGQPTDRVAQVPGAQPPMAQQGNTAYAAQYQFHPSENGQDPARSAWAGTQNNNANSWLQQPRTGPTVQDPNHPGQGTAWNEFGQPRDPTKNPNPELAKDKPSGSLGVAVLLLFVSVGANFYMGWIAARIYRLYLDLADDLEEKERRDPAAAEAVPSSDDHWKDRRKRRRAILGI